VKAGTFTFADFFCGAGGLSLGLRNAGLTPVFAFDSDDHAIRTYRKNLGDHAIAAEAAAITAEVVREHLPDGHGNPDVVCGGPPCQGFSVQRRGDPGDPRNDLIIWFAERAVSLRPAVILIENVPPLLGKRGRHELQRVQEILRESGYHYDSTILEASELGVPQRRRRAFIAAWDPQRATSVVFPKTDREARPRTVRHAIGELPEPPSDFSDHPAFPNHADRRISDLNRLRISHVPPGGGRKDIPAELQLPCHRKDNGHRHLDVYGRMEWDKSAPTLTAMFDNFSRGRFAHPEADRNITAREGARLQSFPDFFVFTGPKKSIARQIGNAVPPLVGELLGKAIVASLRRETPEHAEPHHTQVELDI
jgi:DNA (cytosine-5)-methyltransferase 1